MRRQGDDERSVAVLALGRQRAEVVADTHTCAHSQVRINNLCAIVLHVCLRAAAAGCEVEWLHCTHVWV